jgi:hypothetical protein
MRGGIGVMAVNGKSSPVEFKNWASGIGVRSIDIVLEYLQTKKCFNKKGERLAKEFLGEFIKDGK